MRNLLEGMEALNTNKRLARDSLTSVTSGVFFDENKAWPGLRIRRIRRREGGITIDIEYLLVLRFYGLLQLATVKKSYKYYTKKKENPIGITSKCSAFQLRFQLENVTNQSTPQSGRGYFLLFLFVC